MKLGYWLVFMSSFVANVLAQDNSTIPSTSIPRVDMNIPSNSNSTPQYSISKPFEPKKFKVAPKYAPISMDKEMSIQSKSDVSDLNNGDLLEKKLNKSLSVETGLQVFEANIYFGVIRTKSEYIVIKYRDHSAIDGDNIRVFIDNLIIEKSVILSSEYKEVTVRLIEGKNTISFLALNEGQNSPNTAQFEIKEKSGNVLYNNQWGLFAGYSANIDIVKE